MHHLTFDSSGRKFPGFVRTAFICSLSGMLLLTGCGLESSQTETASSTTSSQENTSAGNSSSGSASTGSLSSAANASLSTSKSNFFFDTVITITIYGTEDSTPIDDCFAQAAVFENLFSNTIEDSEISQINACAGTGEYVTVSDDTLDILEDGIEYCKLSGGAFDITIGKLSSLWNISEITETLDTEDKETDASVIPSDAEIQAALATVDYTAIEIDENKVRLNNADAMIDLGGIAKGYIADRMKETLLADGVTSALINLGGNVLTVGSKPNGNDFRVGVQKPFDSANVLGVVTVSDKSVVTSGVYERYYRVDGKLYHHILDLSTGYPCDNGLYGVTIISDSSMAGDALSTTCFVLGVEKGLELIESLDNTEAIYVTSDMEIQTSSGINNGVAFEEY